MVTLRGDISIEHPAEQVWPVASDAGAISACFPMVATSTATHDHRHRNLEGNVRLERRSPTTPRGAGASTASPAA